MNVPALAVAVVAALLLSASPALAAPAPLADATAASAAAKKKPKKCRKGYVRKRVRGKAKCVRKKKPVATPPPATAAPPAAPAPAAPVAGPAPAAPAAPGYTPPADPIAEFTRLLAGSHLYYLNQSTASSTGASTRREDKVRICSSGTWSRYREDTGVSGVVYPSEAQGTWKVEKAAFGKFQAPDGSPIYRAEAQIAWSSSDPEDPAALIVNIVGRSPDLSAATVLYVGEAEFQRTAGGAGC